MCHVVGLLWLIPLFSAAVRGTTLSPADWPSGFAKEGAALNAIEASYTDDAARRELRLRVSSSVGNGTRGGAAHTQNALASLVSIDVLAKGGNAVDAAIAGSAASIVLSAGSDISFAGTASLLIHNASTGHTVNLLGEYGAVPGNDPQRLNSATEPGAAVFVPGALASFERAVSLFGSGRFTFSELLEPAGYFAEVGFKAGPSLCYLAKAPACVLSRSPEGMKLQASILSHCNGNGNLTQPLLASFIRTVQQDGLGAMYSGDWAAEAVKLVRARGGNLTRGDLERYRNNTVLTSCDQQPNVSAYGVRCVAALAADMGSTTVAVPGLSSGGAEMIEAIRVLNTEQELGDMTTNATALAVLMQLGLYRNHVDSTRYTGDFAGLSELMPTVFPSTELGSFNNFSKLCEYRTSPQYASRVAQYLQSQRNPYSQPSGPSAPTGCHSNAAVTADSDGNVVSMVHTINALAWGSGLVVGGIALPDSGNQFFNQHYLIHNAAYTSNTTIQPTTVPNALGHWIAKKGAQAILAASAIGTGSNTRPMQLLAQLVVRESSPEAAVRAPEYKLDPPRSSTGFALLAAPNCSGEADVMCVNTNTYYNTFPPRCPGAAATVGEA